MSGKFFLDTNIIIYAGDSSRPSHRATSRALLSTTSPVPVISTQVLQEAYGNAVKKLQMSPDQSRRLIERLTKLEVVTVTPDLVLRAIDVQSSASLSFWDALIIAAAASANCDTLYTEDLNDGQIIGGVKIVNPFKDQESP